MGKVFRVISAFFAALFLLVSCERGPRRIPESKFVQIYAEVLIADAWLADHSQVREKADTCLFYEAIFRKYGYTRDDFLYSISERVKDVEEFAKTMEDVEFCINKMNKAISGQKQTKKEFKEANKDKDEVIITSIQ